MRIEELTCIGCPMGCALVVEEDDYGKITVRGNNCKVGERYGIAEYRNPTRIITTIVKVIGGELDYVSVKSEKSISKGEIFKCLKILKNVKINAPINIGDILVENINNTGVNIIATKKVNCTECK